MGRNGREDENDEEHFILNNMLYDNDKVNLLIGLLKAYDIRNAVLCPGSRNAMIVNNIVADGSFKCYPVSDERSAGFFALGISQHKGPVAIVVTSGSALLDVAPAVVEAYYQNSPLIVISADRPQEDIDQNVGQTMRQYGALDNYVRHSVNLTDALGDNTWYHTRLVAEAISSAIDGACGPVHINVPLPDVSECDCTDCPTSAQYVPITLTSPYAFDDTTANEMLDGIFNKAKRPMIVIGQCSKPLDATTMEKARRHMAVLSEPLSDPTARPFDGIIGRLPESLLPDLVIYIGGSLVCRSINSRFASIPDLKVWRIDADGSFRSPFKHLERVYRMRPDSFLTMLVNRMDTTEVTASEDFADKWNDAFAAEEERLESEIDHNTLSAASTVHYFESQLEDMEYNYHVHYANSTAVRLGCRYASGHTIFCNRGVNGIDGSMSTAAGYSAAVGEMTFCVIGDLSFFYDQNALWNPNLNGNLRIILLNNHHGGIFDNIKGLRQCAVRDTFVSGQHKADARGICTQNDIGYISAKTIDEMQLGIVRLMTEDTQRPIVLEVILK